MKDKYADIRAALDAYDDDPSSQYARDCFYGNVDSDTIRALLAGRDALRKFVEAKMHHLPIEDQYVASVLVSALAQEGS